MGRKNAIRDKSDHTQRFQGGGNMRRERETRRAESLSDQDSGTPATEMDTWLPEEEEDGRDDRRSPRRRSRSAQHPSTSPRRDAPTSPNPTAAAPSRKPEAGSSTTARHGAPEGAVTSRNAGRRAGGSGETGAQPQSKIPQNPPLSAPVGGGNGQGMGG